MVLPEIAKGARTFKMHPQNQDTILFEDDKDYRVFIQTHYSLPLEKGLSGQATAVVYQNPEEAQRALGRLNFEKSKMDK